MDLTSTSTAATLSKVPVSAFVRDFNIVRLNVSKATGATRFAVAWSALLGPQEKERHGALEIARKRANKIGGRLQFVNSKECFVFSRHSAFGLRLDILKARKS
jgi:hypothetical protein